MFVSIPQGGGQYIPTQASARTKSEATNRQNIISCVCCRDWCYWNQSKHICSLGECCSWESPSARPFLNSQEGNESKRIEVQFDFAPGDPAIYEP